MTDQALSSELVQLGGGEFRMGSDGHYPEEGPSVAASVDAFAIAPSPVTNGEFSEFVRATGYVTTAERAPTLEDYPDADPAMLVAGSLVFTPPDHPVPLSDPYRWWSYVAGADWRHPLGPGSSLDGLDDHPVVHVSCFDAEAYCRWKGVALPTEAQWEFAARGGLHDTEFAWGDDFQPDGRVMANTWQGDFPLVNDLDDGYFFTSPIGTFPSNGYGLFDMIGNVWEWTASPFDRTAASCCASASLRPGPGHSAAVDRALKGGSYLCAPNYCSRYRPAARIGLPPDTSAGHVGFRCALEGQEGA